MISAMTNKVFNIYQSHQYSSLFTKLKDIYFKNDIDANLIESIINTIDLDKDKNILYYQQDRRSLMYYISRFSNEDKVIHALSKHWLGI